MDEGGGNWWWGKTSSRQGSQSISKRDGSASSGSRITWDDTAKYHVLFCPTSVTNLPKSLLKADTNLAVSFLGQVSSAQGLQVNSAARSATWTVPVMRKAELEIKTLMGQLVPHKERLVLMDRERKRTAVECDIDMSGLCRPLPFQIVLPVGLGDKDNIVLTMKVITLPDQSEAEDQLFARASTEISFMLEELSASSCENPQALSDFKSLLEVKSREVASKQPAPVQTLSKRNRSMSSEDSRKGKKEAVPSSPIASFFSNLFHHKHK